MFKCVVNDREKTRLLKNVIDVLASVIQKETAQLSLDAEKLTIKALNTNQSAFILLTLHPKFFAEFEAAAGQEDAAIGLQLEDIKKVLSRAKDTDKVTLEHAGSEVFNVTFQSEQFLKRFTLPLEEIVNLPPQIQPDALGLQTSIKVAPGFLKEVIADVASIGRTLRMELTEDNLIIKTSEEQQELEIKVSYSQLGLKAEDSAPDQEGEEDSTDETGQEKMILDVSGETGFSVKYSLDNLQYLSKIDPHAIQTTLEAEEEKPLRVTMHFTGGQVTLDCLLSPVTESDD
ncbi:MAG: hypothetical protein ACXAEU_20315 [Candidatus Hodarchaeales archaeon]|jgi:hypothetical protein